MQRNATQHNATQKNAKDKIGARSIDRIRKTEYDAEKGAQTPQHGP